MTARENCNVIRTWVAIDIAKKWNVIAIEATGYGFKHFRVSNTRLDHD